jgi:phosphatidylglycerophosphate synthase
MKNFLGILAILGTGFGQILLIGIILALILPEKWSGVLAWIFGVLLVIAFVVMLVKFIKNFYDLTNGKF